MSTPFIYNSNRSANDVIRGFHYQIELTVLRWLELEGENVIYCEAGEDIDHIKIPLSESLGNQLSEEQIRILEQIKDRTDAISLRNKEAIIALARFREAVMQNPTVNILFRYSTTAFISKEQKVNFPDNLPGIRVWEDIRNGIIGGQKADSFVQEFKRFVRDTIDSPSKLPPETFNQFKQYVETASNQELIDNLIKRFEWSTNLPEILKLENEIQKLLLAKLHATDEFEANRLTKELKVYILELLSENKEKKLSVQSLADFISNSLSLQSDKRLLDRIEQHLNDIDFKVQDLSNRVLNLESTSFSIQLPLADEPPPSIQEFIKREKVVNSLSNMLTYQTWLHINGQTGLGKTYIAKLIAELPIFNKKEWIFLGTNEDSSINNFNLHLLRIANTPYIPDLMYRYSSGLLTFSDLAKLVASRIGKGNLLVIDDLPDLIKKSFQKLAECIKELSIAIQEVGAKLITTSQRNLPSIFNNVSSFTTEQSLPFLTEEEIIDFSKTLNAPISFLSVNSYFTLIQKITNGHPQLVHATLLYIRNSGWLINEDSFYSLLEGNATSNIKEDLQRKIFDLLKSDNNLRNLLYRLSLLPSTFDSSFVSAIASIPKPIDLALELLRELVGPWISKVSKTSYEISPVIKGIGKDVLELDLQKLIHYVIAKSYRRKRNITPQEAVLIINHFSASGHWSDLTFFVCELSLQIHSKFEAELFYIIKYYFVDDWPNNMETELRMLFRSCQIHILGFLGEDDSKYVQQLNLITKSIENTKDPKVQPFLFLTYWMRLMFNPSLRPSVTAENILKIINLLPSLPPDMQVIESNADLEPIIWMGVQNIKKLQDIRDTFDVLSKMTEEKRKKAFSDESFKDIPRIFIDNCWMLELEKPLEAQNWKEVIALIDHLQTIASLPGAEPIKALVVRAKAIAMEELSEKLDDSIKLIKDFLENADDSEKPILKFTAGYILFKHQKHADALKYFKEALKTASLPLLVEYDCIRLAIQSAGKLNQQETAKKLIFRSFRTISLLFTNVAKDKEMLMALKEKKGNVLIPEEEAMESHCIYYKLRMLGELAWVYWLVDDKKRAWATMSGLVNKLMEKVDFKNPHFQELAMKIGRTLAWMDSMLNTGKPPMDANGQSYEILTGFFVNDWPQMAQTFQPNLFPLLSFLLGKMAVCLGLYELACYKFAKAKQFAERLNTNLVGSIENALKEIPLTIAKQRDYKKAFSLTLLTIKVTEESKADFKKRKPRSPITYHYIQTLWDDLPKETQHNSQLALFWTTIGIGITELLSRRATVEEYQPLLNKFETLFTANNEALADSHYWISAIEKLKEIFSSPFTKKTLNSYFSSLPQNETHLKTFLCLGGSFIWPTNLQDSCHFQILAFCWLFSHLPSTKSMLESFTSYIRQYWTSVLNTQSFALNTPKLFRDTLNSIDKNSISAASKILTAASNAVNVKIPENLKTYLKQGSEIDFQL